MHRNLIALLLVVSMILACSSMGFAAASPSGTKLSRGCKNLGLGWTDIPKTIVDTSKQSNAFVGITIGTLKGVCQAVARTVSGAVDVVTFPVGTYDRPVIKPSMIQESPASASTTK